MVVGILKQFFFNDQVYAYDTFKYALCESAYKSGDKFPPQTLHQLFAEIFRELGYV